MEKNLPVPYRSQWDDDASGSNNDCGPASIAMVDNFFGGKVTTDDILINLGYPKGLIGFDQMFSAIKQLGYTYTYFDDGSVEKLKGLIDQGYPVIILVHYGRLQSTQDKLFKGGHFMCVTGYRPDDSFYVNDPDFKDPFRHDGDHHVYTRDEIVNAWLDCTKDGNKPNQGIVILPVSPVAGSTPKNFKVQVTVDGLRVRTSADATSPKNIVKGAFYKLGDVITCNNIVIGTPVDGNSTWLKIKGSSRFVWAGGTDWKPSEDPVVTPEPPIVIDWESISKNLVSQRDSLLKAIGELNKTAEAVTRIADTQKDQPTKNPIQKLVSAISSLGKKVS